MRIAAGRLKGRSIPFQAPRFGGIRVTSGRLKGAVFSMLGEDLTGRRFLDLCGGSGQMGLEACSRGAHAVINEPDQGRRRFIETQIEKLGLEGQARITDAVAERLIVTLRADEPFDAIYVDPPYDARLGDTLLSEVLLSALGNTPLTAAGGIVMVQHSRRQGLPERAGRLLLNRHRLYGDTQLSLFSPG